MSRRLAALCLAVALSLPGCGAIDRFVEGVDPDQVEATGNIVGAILYDAAGMALDSGWIDVATAAKIDESLTRAEAFANQGNVGMAKLAYAQVRAMIPVEAIVEAEAKAGKTVDEAMGGLQ